MAGTIDKGYTVWCGKCADWDRQERVTKPEAITWWRRIGWRLTKEDGWVCPRCGGFTEKYDGSPLSTVIRPKKLRRALAGAKPPRKAPSEQ